jgi:hypothetical protein
MVGRFWKPCIGLAVGGEFDLMAHRSAPLNLTVVVPHSPSRTLPSLEEVLRTFHRQACLATALRILTLSKYDLC